MRFTMKLFQRRPTNWKEERYEVKRNGAKKVEALRAASASVAVSGNDKYNRLVASVHVIRCVSFTVTHLSRKRQGIITEDVRAKE